MNLYIIHKPGTKEFWASELSLEALNEMQDDYFSFIGQLDSEDIAAMRVNESNPDISIDCVNYALEFKKFAIPMEFELFTVTIY